VATIAESTRVFILLSLIVVILGFGVMGLSDPIGSLPVHDAVDPHLGHCVRRRAAVEPPLVWCVMRRASAELKAWSSAPEVNTAVGQADLAPGAMGIGEPVMRHRCADLHRRGLRESA